MNTTKYTVTYKMQVTDPDTNQIMETLMTVDCEDMAELLRQKRNIVRRKGFVDGSLNVEEVTTDEIDEEVDSPISISQREVESDRDVVTAEPEVVTADDIVITPEEVADVMDIADAHVVVDGNGFYKDSSLWMPIRRAAEYLKVAAQQAYQRTYRNRMQSCEIDGVTHVLISEVEEWKAQREARAAK